MQLAFLIISVIFFVLAGLPLFPEPYRPHIGWWGLAFFAGSFLVSAMAAAGH